MKKIFLQSQIKELDRQTIERQGITSLELMERAAMNVADYIMNHWQPGKIVIVAGPGNNGGDGLVVARILSIVGYDVVVYNYTGRSQKRSDDCESNYRRLPARVEKHVDEEKINFAGAELVVDALFGTGLSRAVDGKLADVIGQINHSGIAVLSIDMPSGMGDEDMICRADGMPIVRADLTIAFQQPKLAFLMQETGNYVGEWMITDIGIDQSAMQETSTNFYYIEKDDVERLLKKRSRFAHKGTTGKALIIAGKKGMMGAAQMCGKSCLRSGIGLLTMVVPEAGYEIMQTCVPEAMTLTMGNDWIEQSDVELPRVDAIGIGPGLGRELVTKVVVENIAETDKPIVMDADALWHMRDTLKAGKLDGKGMMILTPHEGEFDRMSGIETGDRYSRIRRAVEMAADMNIVIVLKGAYTAICTPQGKIFINSTGNAGMATGGSGDVLTGILTALMAQGYSAEEASVIGVYIHGLAGDKAKEKRGEMGMTAMDIVDNLGEAWKMFNV